MLALHFPAQKRPQSQDGNSATSTVKRRWAVHRRRSCAPSTESVIHRAIDIQERRRGVFPSCRNLPGCYATVTMKISEALSPFISYCRAERQVSPSSLAKYQDCFQCWLLPVLGEQEVRDLNQLEILKLREAMLARQISISRQYSVIVCLKSFLKFCRSGLGIVCIDPAEIRLPRRPAPSVQYLENEEIQKMLDAIDIHTFTGVRLRALTELLLSTGMRISEALSLTRDVFENGQAEAEIVGKGRRKRQVFFSPRSRFWVKEYLKRRVDDDGALFVTTGFPVRRWAREDISRFFVLLRRRTGISKKLTPHLLRHTFCTNLSHNGADITHIRDLAGHQDIQTTARYYIGKDTRVLRRVVQRFLHYGTESMDAPLGNRQTGLSQGNESTT